MASRQEAIAEAVRQRVISGLHFETLQAGDRLPSARALAEEFDADARSVTAAFRRLQREGLIVRRPPSRAYYVASPAVRGKFIGPGEGWLADVLVGALSRGVTVPEFSERVRRSVDTLRLRAVCLECNTDQEEWLCRELQESFGLETLGVELEDAERRAAEIRDADLLVTTPAHGAEVQRLAERFDKPWIVVAIRQDLAREIARLLAAGPLYFIGTDPRFAGKLRRMYAGAPGSENLRTIVLGVDDPGSIPDGSPAYVMRTARDQLGGPPAQVRALATLRAFAAETARAIVAFIIRENIRAGAARAAVDSQSRGRLMLVPG